jgi:flagellar motor switch protein FliG
MKASSTITTPAAPAMSKIQRLAAFLIMVGPESAAPLLRGLPADQVRQVTTEMARLPFIDQATQEELLKEFGDLATQATGIKVGGVEIAQSALEKALGPAKAAEILGHLTHHASLSPAMQEIAALDARLILSALRHEQPQTIALIVSFLPPDKASAVLLGLPADLRDPVIERLATIEPLPLEVVDKLATVLRRQIGAHAQPAVQQSGGVRTAARLLNIVPRDASKAILDSLEQRRPELGQAIRQKMFTFEDLGALDTWTLQRILREVEARTLALALKPMPDEFKATLFKALSKRAAETVNEEISFLGKSRRNETLAAQRLILEAAQKLEADGEIELIEKEIA